MLSSTSSPLCRRQRGSLRKGAAVVEFAVLAPFLATLFLGAIDLSRAFYYSTTIDNCAWNAAMFGGEVLTPGAPGTSETWNATTAGQTYTTATQAGLVDGTNLSPSLTTTNFTYAGQTTDADTNNVYKVTVAYDFKLISGLLNIGKITIKRSAQVRIPPTSPT